MLKVFTGNYTLIVTDYNYIMIIDGFSLQKKKKKVPQIIAAFFEKSHGKFGYFRPQNQKKFSQNTGRTA